MARDLNKTLDAILDRHKEPEIRRLLESIVQAAREGDGAALIWLHERGLLLDDEEAPGGDSESPDEPRGE